MRFLPSPKSTLLSLYCVSASITFILLTSITVHAEIININSQREFDQAHDIATENDTIVWRSGTYEDIFMDITEDNLYIKAEVLGSVIFTGASRVDIRGDFVSLEGFQFLGGDIGTSDVINTRGSYNVFTQINIRDYRSYKYLRVREESQYTQITYCNFENRLNLDDQNILSILVDDNQPGYHKIQYCSFKNFDGSGNDLGIEPIRIGVSTQADNISRSLVEYCYFTLCNGDGELISSKATQNVYRFNTFENNPKAELVLRHGSEAIVYGNFFLNGKGGVRVREGQDHYIYNNYFYNIDDRAIYLQNEDSDPLDNINIAFNTIVDCSEVILGGDGGDPPTNVTFANNIFANPDDNIFEEPTGRETWISNVVFGDLGMPLPESGMTMTDPDLIKNSQGFFGFSDISPAIDAAETGFKRLPQFEGMDPYDTEILMDIMGQDRPVDIEDRDLGCNEFPHEILIQPLATEENTGPSYNSSTTTSVQNNILIVQDLFDVNPNPVIDKLNITIDSSPLDGIQVDIFNSNGRNVRSILDQSKFRGKTTIVEDITDLPSGLYTVRAISEEQNSSVKRIQAIKIVKPR